MPQKIASFNSPFYYPSLDGLRFVAFLLVFFYHSLSTVTSRNILGSFLLTSYVRNGWVGVDLFFVLSGFLITSILLKEKIKFGSVSLKKFWLRRILRIWPLYYLGLFTFYVILPQLSGHFGINYVFLGNEGRQLPLHLVFLGNLAIIIFGFGTQIINGFWTVSVEEQFYILWPILFKWLKARLFFLTSLGMLFAAPVFRLFFSYFPDKFQWQIIHMNLFTRIDVLMYGVILAIVLFKFPKIHYRLKGFLNIYIFTLILFMFSVFLFKIEVLNPQLKLNITFGYSLIAIFMAYLLFCSLQKDFFLSKILSTKPLVYLGKISYGLYIWHTFVIATLSSILKLKSNSIFMSLIFLAVTILVASASYYLFELRFLKLKKYYSRIQTRPI